MTQPVPDRTVVPPLAEQSSVSIFDRLKSLLTSQSTPIEPTSHRPVFTSAEAAAIRGESLHGGDKTLAVNVGSQTESVRMKYADYVAIEKPLVEVFSEDGATPA